MFLVTVVYLEEDKDEVAWAVSTKVIGLGNTMTRRNRVVRRSIDAKIFLLQSP
jgi:hypothetical protein